ncbi:MAG: hypothetical protein AM326_02330 [Candidatus Thorarchaeota archaeon SMTZ-45]|nr:MAG: hypothetical protein AM326_02330 [Candidatus Thorarchaeota archaeon SMTZ-45]
MYLTRDVLQADYEEYTKEGAKGLWHLSLLGPENSTSNFALRAYIIDSGGHSAPDNHRHEHGVYVLTGILKVKVGEQMLELKQGDVIHIAAYEPHQFLNPGQQPAKFLCVRDFP